ncbi:MAG: hypothetical protein FWC70_13340 [Defluviitaleaceae bacterium]|nr:hypothetical protein [Defluviitaleaceae bacterium]
MDVTYAPPIKDTPVPVKGPDAPAPATPPPVGTASTAAAPATQSDAPEILTQTLLTYGYKATEENKAMLRLMLENGMPLTESAIRRMNQALKLAQSPERALFMLQNGIRMNPANAALLEGFVSGQTKIASQLNALLAAVDSLQDPALAAKLKQILSGQPAGTPTGEASGQATQAGQPPAGSPASGDSAHNATQPQSVTGQSATVAQTQPATGQPAGTPASGQSAAQSAGSFASATTAPPPAGLTAPQASAQTQTAQGQISSGESAHSATQQPASSAAQTQSAQGQVTPGESAAAPQAAGLSSSGQSATAPSQTVAQTSASGSVATAAQQSAGSPGQSAQTIAATASSATATSQVAANQVAVPSVAPSAQSSAPLPQSLLFPLENSTPESIERYFSNLRETLSQVELTVRGNPDAARVMQEVRTLESQLDFASQIRNQIFVQVPLYHDGRQTPLNLHVYKDAKKSGGGGGETSSALISLDTSSLGHFETYVRKTSRAVQCQFRLENEKTVALVRDNIHTLDALLREHGYSLEHFSFLPPGEPYTVLDNPSDPPESLEVSRFDKIV